MSKKYDASQYETVKERKIRFYQKYEDGRIVVSLVDTVHMDYVIVNAAVFISVKDQEKNLPRGTGYALEVRDKELKVSNYGKEYESVNYTSWLENCEESAIGRALDNAGFSGNRKCSLEEMEKTERNAQAIKSRTETKCYDSHVFSTGKYSGKKFAEITDRGWLQWVKENHKNSTIKQYSDQRLKELAGPDKKPARGLETIVVEESEFDFGEK